jgi:hypothetical protein
MPLPSISLTPSRLITFTPICFACDGARFFYFQRSMYLVNSQLILYLPNHVVLSITNAPYIIGLCLVQIVAHDICVSQKCSKTN